MSNSMRTAFRRLCLSLALASGFVMTSFAVAAPDADSAAAVQASTGDLQELDEIFVRGKSLSRMIEDAEDKFVRHYNKVNKNNKFDVVCDYLRLDRDSLALTRTCVPYFLGYLGVGSGVGAGMGFRGIPQASAPPPICSAGNYITSDGATYYSPGTCSPAIGVYTMNMNSMIGGISAPTRIQTSARPQKLGGPVVPEKQRQEYLRSVMRAIYSDQRLVEDATSLAGLYGEMESIQDQYRKAKAEEDARKQAARSERLERRTRNATSPRANNPRP